MNGMVVFLILLNFDFRILLHKMERQRPIITDEEMTYFQTEFGLTFEQIIEFHAEFKAYDNDGNGLITIKDLGEVNKAFGGNIKEIILQEWIKKRDLDKDETVNFYEFLKFNAMLSKQKQGYEGLFCDKM